MKEKLVPKSARIIVYRATNRVSGKIYIGKTIRTLSHAMARHRQRAKNLAKGGYESYFYASIRKHGWEAFDWEIIDQGGSDVEIQELERAWIAHTRSFDDRSIGYNMTPGGDGGAGRSLSPVQIEKLKMRVSGEGNFGWGKYGAAHPAFGHVKSDEARAAISRAHKGRVVSEETRRKMSASRIALFAEQTAETERRRQVEQEFKRAKREEKRAAGDFCEENARASKVTNLQRKEMCLRRAAGESYQSISQDFPLGLTGVRAVVKTWGPQHGYAFEHKFAASNHRSKLTHGEREDVITRHRAGEKIAELATRFGVGSTTIYSTLTDWGPRNGFPYVRLRGAWENAGQPPSAPQ